LLVLNQKVDKHRQGAKKITAVEEGKSSVWKSAQAAPSYGCVLPECSHSLFPHTSLPLQSLVWETSQLKTMSYLFIFANWNQLHFLKQGKYKNSVDLVTWFNCDSPRGSFHV
jgi:hypothetical protein